MCGRAFCRVVWTPAYIVSVLSVELLVLLVPTAWAVLDEEGFEAWWFSFSLTERFGFVGAVIAAFLALTLGPLFLCQPRRYE